MNDHFVSSCYEYESDLLCMLFSNSPLVGNYFRKANMLESLRTQSSFNDEYDTLMERINLY